MLVALDYTLDQFINTNIYLGYTKQFTLSTSFSYLKGIRAQVCIINLHWSIICLKKAYGFLSNLFKNFGSLWLVNFNKFFFFPRALKKFIYSYIQYRIIFWGQPWSSGVLTNFKFLLKNLKLNWRYIWYPNTIFFLTSHQHPGSIKEPNLVNIAVFAITDTSMGAVNNVNCVPGNEKTYSAFYLYNQIMQNFLIKILLLKKLLFKKNIFNKYNETLLKNK